MCVQIHRIIHRNNWRVIIRLDIIIWAIIIWRAIYFIVLRWSLIYIVGFQHLLMNSLSWLGFLWPILLIITILLSIISLSSYLWWSLLWWTHALPDFLYARIKLLKITIGSFFKTLTMKNKITTINKRRIIKIVKNPYPSDFLLSTLWVYSYLSCLSS